MADPKQALQADVRHALDVLAEAWLDHRRSHPDENAAAWFDDLRRKIEARATTLAEVATMGPMGGGGQDEA
jgi:hypothetical protein